MSTLSIGSSAIRQFDGLYSLNDLHKASGALAKNKPTNWLRLEQTQDLIQEIMQVSDMSLALKTVHGGANRGTYACKELVIAYAAWINAAFHLKVIRVFLATTNQTPQIPQIPPTHLMVNRNHVLNIWKTATKLAREIDMLGIVEHDLPRYLLDK